ncbi:MAG TPA: M67 family metallopeptidase [Anaerolineales bacterium]|nr:M67 family metallopeptidase [Anaerolineales bacterium]
MDILNHQPRSAIQLKSEHWEKMRSDVDDRAPEEACGLVAGLDSSSTAVFPITNLLHSQVRFRMDPQEQLAAFKGIDDHDWTLLAIYHSHPQGPHGPSRSDIAETTYPGVISLIWSRFHRKWDCRGYLIQGGEVAELPVVVS